MIFTELDISGAFIIKPKIFKDERGYFLETWNKKQFNTKIGYKVNFVQDNLSKSKQNVLRGLHYQRVKPQGKLVRVSSGLVYDVIVDLRIYSPTFLKWVGVNISASNKKIIWVPPGCAHGFIVLSKSAVFLYKTTEYWFPNYEECILWNYKDLNINWNLKKTPNNSE